MEKKVYELIKDPELEHFLPKPSPEKLEILVDSIIDKGVLEPIYTWNGIIVDGYTRYGICHELQIPFEYVELEFSNKDEVKFFMLQKQIGRRELTVFQKCEILYPLEKFIAERVEKQRRKAISQYRKCETSRLIDWSQDTQDTGTTIAKYASTTRDVWYKAKALIKEADKEAKKLLRIGELKICPTYKRLKAGLPLIPKNDPEAEANTEIESVVDSEEHLEEVSNHAMSTLSSTTRAKPDVEKETKVTENSGVSEVSEVSEGKKSSESGKLNKECVTNNTDSVNGVNDVNDVEEANNADEADDADDIGFGRKSVSDSAVNSKTSHDMAADSNSDTGVTAGCKIHFDMGAPLEAELEAELEADGKAGTSDDEDWETDDVDIDHDPCMNPHLNQVDVSNPETKIPKGKMIFPEMPKREPIPFPCVREQIEYSVRTMLFDLLVGLYGLRDEDLDRRDEILEIVKQGFKKAKKLIERETTRK